MLVYWFLKTIRKTFFYPRQKEILVVLKLYKKYKYEKQRYDTDFLQTQQKNSISQKQEISWHAKLTSDYGHMYVMLFPRHLQSATKLVETICHRGPLLRFASLEKLKLNFPHPLHTMSCHCSRKRKQPNIEWRGGGGGGKDVNCFVLWSYLIWVQCIVFFCEVISFKDNVCMPLIICTLNLGRITSQQALLRPFPIAVYFCIISSFPFALHPSSHFTS